MDQLQHQTTKLSHISVQQQQIEKERKNKTKDFS